MRLTEGVKQQAGVWNDSSKEVNAGKEHTLFVQYCMLAVNTWPQPGSRMAGCQDSWAS